ncbi:hemolysin family protein [Oligoflexia bacterium]|nr:hemolysin family protein [Oligoflexia bacterium]
MDPLFLLVLAVLITIFVSACCSVMEAALYAVPLTHVRLLAESGSRTGEILLGFKGDIGRPIAAILILNTMANTGGASVAGWTAAKLLSEGELILFSVAFVLAILYFSEILPKIVGVVYCKTVAKIVARPLFVIIKLLSPLVAVSQGIAHRIEEDNHQPTVSEAEVLSMAALGTEEGSLDHFEGSVITNVVGLDRLLVKDVLTPRVVTFRLEENTKVCDVREDIGNWNFSRVPLFSESDPDHLTAYVIQRDIYRELLNGYDQMTLKELSRALPVVPELMRADQMLLQMFEKKEHICAVVDEHGGLAGLVTMEDIIEEIVGREIVDEYDSVSDLRTFARILRVVKGRKKKE